MRDARFSVEPAATVLQHAAGEALAVIGRREQLRSQRVLEMLPPELAAPLPALLARLEPGDAAVSTTLWLTGDQPARDASRTPAQPIHVAVGVLPDRASRHDAPGRPDQVEALARSFVAQASAFSSGATLRLLVAAHDADEALAAATAVARAVPRYSRKSEAHAIQVVLGVCSETQEPPDAATLDVLCDAVREAGRLQDMPADALHTDAFVAEARALADAVGARCTVIRGIELEERGFGGLWGVGRGAARPPALVVLSHEPAAPKPGITPQTLAWVGKGIVYDSGGLSLKTNAELAGMKGDMGGAASVLSAFGAAARLAAPHRIHALLCIAENAIGPHAMRVDDILTLYSGKTVEIRNTDSEGRLVLGDGVAYAARHLAPDVVVDMATLTGGAVVATGKRHAAIVCNDEALEAQVIRAGRAVGDLVHPLPYCPELFRAELSSDLADLCNYARDPTNANAGCAAQFVAEHLAGFDGPWLHVDMEGPSRSADGRGTGFGVGLLLRTFGCL